MLRSFWLAFVINFHMFAMTVVSSTDLVPPGVADPGHRLGRYLPLAAVAGSHILYQIVLNPWLIILSY